MISSLALYLMIPGLILFGAALFSVILAARWSRNPGLGGFAAFLGAVLALGASGFVPPDISLGGIPLTILANLIFSSSYLFTLPYFAFPLTGKKLSRGFEIFNGLSVMAILASALVLGFISWSHPVLAALSMACFGITGAYIIFLFRRRQHMGDILTRRLMVRFLGVSAACLPLFVLDSLGTTQGWTWISGVDGSSVPFFLLATALTILMEARLWLQNLAQKGSGSSTGEGSDELAGTAEGTAGLAGSGGSALASRSGSTGERENPAPAPGKVLADQGLSPRQQEIALLIYQGDSAKEIAAKLDISPKTAENYTYSIYQKLGVNSRLQFYTFIRQLLG